MAAALGGSSAAMSISPASAAGSLDAHTEPVTLEEALAALHAERARYAALADELKTCKRRNVAAIAEMEAEEEAISNRLSKRLAQLQAEKATLALEVEAEEEAISNRLGKRLAQLQAEKVALQNTLEQESEFVATRLHRQLQGVAAEKAALEERLAEAERARSGLQARLAAEEAALARSAEALRERVAALQREKGALEAGMEAEQEALVLRMGRQVEALTRERDAALGTARGALQRLRSSLCGSSSSGADAPAAGPAAAGSIGAGSADIERAIDAALAELAALPRLTSPLGQPHARLSIASRSPVPSPRSPAGADAPVVASAGRGGGSLPEHAAAALLASAPGR